jgi:uncharacterized membrane protein YkgB
MDFLIRSLIRLGILKKDLDYHLLRALMVIICLFFGYQKWFDYEAQALIPYVSHGPVIFWLYPVFGIRGATYFLGASEWLFGALLFAGFWIKKLGFSGTWAYVSLCSQPRQSLPSRRTVGPLRPAAFLMKDLVLFGVSFYLLRQDVMRVPLANTSSESAAALHQDLRPTG